MDLVTANLIAPAMRNLLDTLSPGSTEPHTFTVTVSRDADDSLRFSGMSFVQTPRFADAIEEEVSLPNGGTLKVIKGFR